MVFNNILFKDRVTKPQKKMLITLLRETKFMEGKKEKEWYWEKIQAALNTIGPKKTIIQWKKCWRDMRLTTRKKLAELKRCQLAGGSPPPGIELNQEDQDIIEIVGQEYFYEEMNGDLKPETFISSFDYVPEHFCDAILSAAAASSGQAQQQQQQQHQQHMQHPKDQQHQGGQQQQQDHHTNDGETNDAAGSSNHTDSHGGAFQGVGQLQNHNGEHNGTTNGSNGPGGGGGPGTSQQSHPNMPQHPAFHTGLHPHLLRRSQQAAAAFQRETTFEEKFLQLMQDAFPKRSKKRKHRDPDKLFLLSLHEEMKRVPEEIRLDVKTELIQVLKKYQKKAPVKQEKTHSHNHSQTVVNATNKPSNAGTPDKLQMSQHTQLSHSMYQLQKKYEKSDKEDSQHSHDASNATVTAVVLHPGQQMNHTLFQLQKKYEDNAEKVHQQNEQRKHVEPAHQQHQVAHQQPPPPAPNEQHLHHPQMQHSILFPLTQIRNEQPGNQHHAHNPHQQQTHPHQQQPQQHHPPTIFGAPTSTAPMSSDRPAMAYENVG